MRNRLTPPHLAGVALDDFLQRLDGNSTWKPDEEDISIILANFDIDADERIAPRLTFERHMQIVEAMWGFPTYERYSRLRCPTLALPARDGFTGQGSGKRLARGIACVTTPGPSGAVIHGGQSAVIEGS